MMKIAVTRVMQLMLNEFLRQFPRRFGAETVVNFAGVDGVIITSNVDVSRLCFAAANICQSFTSCISAAVDSGRLSRPHVSLSGTAAPVCTPLITYRMFEDSVMTRD